MGALEVTLDLLYTLKLMVDTLDQLNIFEQWKLRRDEPTAAAEASTEDNNCQVEEIKEEEEVKTPARSTVNKLVQHPFAGYLSKIVSLVCSLTYRANLRVEDFFMSPDGKLRLGAILSHTKMDVDNPMLREWCLVAIRNLCSWSERIREDLKKLQLIEVAPEGKETLN